MCLFCPLEYEKKTSSKAGCFRKIEEIFISGLAAKTAPPKIPYYQKPLMQDWVSRLRNKPSVKKNRRKKMTMTGRIIMAFKGRAF